MKKNWKHINLEQRKLIRHLLSKKAKLKEIAELLDLDPSSVSRELKRNRSIRKYARTYETCKKLSRFPYVCNSCHLKYTTCPFMQYVYDPKVANNLAKQKLVLSRKGIDMTDDEYKVLDRLIKEGTDRNESIYHIVHSHEEINKSVPTIYRYINNGYLTTKRMDLPFAVSYKKRKKSNKKYEYHENKNIDRSNRTYLDYLSYIQAHPNVFVVQMDFLGSIKTDRKSILTLIIPELHFVILRIIEDKNSQKVVDVFNDIQDKIGIEAFKKIFPVILTDRDPSFSDMVGIESDHDTGELRTRLFFCDAFKSNQKASVENMNKQLRKYFPKKASVDNLTDEDMTNVMNFINNLRVPSLSGSTPTEAFIRVYGEDILNKLMK